MAKSKANTSKTLYVKKKNKYNVEKNHLMEHFQSLRLQVQMHYFLIS